MIIQLLERTMFVAGACFLMVQGTTKGDDLLRESRQAEMALIDEETRAERKLASAEKRYRRAIAQLVQAQERVEARRRDFEQSRSRLDQCQLERAAGPMLRRASVARPALPRPARDDSRARTGAAAKQSGPVPKSTDPTNGEPA